MFPENLAELSEAQIKEKMADLLGQLNAAYNNTDIAIVIQSFASYLSYMTQDKVLSLQRDINKQTEEVIKANKSLVRYTKILAGATVLLAVATFTLGYLTWAKK